LLLTYLLTYLLQPYSADADPPNCINEPYFYGTGRWGTINEYNTESEHSYGRSDEGMIRTAGGLQ